MNYFEYKTGKLSINNKIYELSKSETIILNNLIDNKLKTSNIEETFDSFCTSYNKAVTSIITLAKKSYRN